MTFQLGAQPIRSSMLEEKCQHTMSETWRKHACTKAMPIYELFKSNPRLHVTLLEHAWKQLGVLP
jgi:hypothetical protein